MDDRHTFTTDATPEDEQFEITAEKAVEQFRDRLYEGHFYGPETDGMLRQAMRASLADSGTVSLRELYEHFAEPPVEPEAIGKELRELVDDADRDEWERGPPLPKATVPDGDQPLMSARRFAGEPRS
jgi:hypothetical protein